LLTQNRVNKNESSFEDIIIIIVVVVVVVVVVIIIKMCDLN